MLSGTLEPVRCLALEKSTMNRTSLVAWALLTQVPFTTRPALAQEKSWKGESVIYKKNSKDIKFGDVIDGKEVFFSFSGRLPIIVRAEKEGWLRVFDGNHEGWADKDDFILARDAPAYFHGRVQANPKDAWALFMRGVGWEQKGELDNAIQDYAECIRLSPSDSHPYVARGNAWQAKKEYDKAIWDYDAAIRLDPKFVLAFNGRGNAWQAKKEYEKAIRDYDEAIRLDRKLVLAFNGRGNTWRDHKEYDKAIRDYDEAIRLDPKFIDAFNGRGNAWSDKKEYDKAIRDFDEAIRLDPKCVLALNNRGNAWSDKKEYDKAIRDFDEAIRLDPKADGVYFSRAVVWYFKRDFEKAVRDFEDANRINPKEAYTVILGHIAAARQENRSASARFLNELSRNLKDEWPYPILRFLRGEIDEPELLKLATDKDKQTEVHCYLGLDHAIKRREGQAIAHFRWVKEQGNPGFIEYTLAGAELEQLEKTSKK
jgi:tetratricopeptide (TPR) repeat protein